MSELLHVLYVEDDEDIRTIATMSLALDPTLAVQSAASGEEALRLLAGTPVRPDVVLLDVMMAGMDGRELAQRIRTLPGLETVPLIFMTARARDADLAEYRALGAAEVIAKPFDPLELARTIRRISAR